MPVAVERIKAGIPKQKRNRPSVLELSPEFGRFLEELDKGLKKDQAIKIVLSKETMGQLQQTPKMFLKLLKKTLAQLELPYRVYPRGKENDLPVFYIGHKMLD